MIDGGANGAICMAVGLVYSNLLLLALSIADFTIDIKVRNFATQAHIGASILLIVSSMAIIYKSYEVLYGQDAADCFGLGVALGLSINTGLGTLSNGGFKSRTINFLLYILEAYGLWNGVAAGKDKKCHPV